MTCSGEFPDRHTGTGIKSGPGGSSQVMRPTDAKVPGLVTSIGPLRHKKAIRTNVHACRGSIEKTYM